MTEAGSNDQGIRWYAGQAWRDLLSVYYANTPTWRWLKSGALVFMAFFLWTGSSVVLSVQPGWTPLYYTMAYGFLLLVWGPLTHLLVVPLTIRLRRTAQHPVTRTFARNSGKINLAIFFALVAVFGTLTPGIMLLEFSPTDDGGGGGEIAASGDVVCEFEDPIICRVEDARGIDHVVVTSGGEVVATDGDPPFEVTFERADLAETRTGSEFRVEFRNENDETVRRFVRTVPAESSG